jgi:hypothetical protein
MSALSRVLQARTTQNWNALIPKRAKCVEIVGGKVRYLHPTKGWRLVSLKRLGLA